VFFKPRRFLKWLAPDLSASLHKEQWRAIEYLPLFQHATFDNKVWNCQRHLDCACALEFERGAAPMMNWRGRFLPEQRYRVVLILRDPHVGER
jgi:hypothetical protein